MANTVRDNSDPRDVMASAIHRGVVQGGSVVFRDKELPWMERTEVFVTAMPPTRGMPTSILAALESSVRVPEECVDELERLIAEGLRMPMQLEPFPNEFGSQESQ